MNLIEFGVILFNVRINWIYFLFGTPLNQFYRRLQQRRHSPGDKRSDHIFPYSSFVTYLLLLFDSDTSNYVSINIWNLIASIAFH